MTFRFLVAILAVLTIGSGYWYRFLDTPCDVPISYRIGSIDERFGTTPEEVARIALQAELLWEKPLTADLFVFDPTSDFPINLVFDSRQETSDREREFREELAHKEGLSESVRAEYDQLVTKFQSKNKTYESRVVAYETRLAAYNEKVTGWNAEGGAPEAEVKKLKETEATLKEEHRTLESLARELDALVASLNDVGAEGNLLIRDYNTIVREYNDAFSVNHEFTQGDYVQDAINVYQFDSEEELTLVLGHEFGHALSIGHVEGETSLMYPTMGAQRVAQGITNEDRKAYTQVCTERTFLDRAFRLLGSVMPTL